MLTLWDLDPSVRVWSDRRCSSSSSSSSSGSGGGDHRWLESNFNNNNYNNNNIDVDVFSTSVFVVLRSLDQLSSGGVLLCTNGDISVQDELLSTFKR